MNLSRHQLFYRVVAAVTGISMLSTFTLPAGSRGKAVLSEPVIEPQEIYLGTFNTGVKTSDVYTEGNVSFVVPVWSTLGSDGTLGGGTVFLTPYVSLGEQGELATSLGLGWRYLFSDQSVSALKSGDRASFLSEGFYIGANVFVDNLRTQFDNDFWQLGIGAEIGSRYLEVRGNYYLPFSNSQKLAERTTSTRNFTSTSRQSSTSSQSTGTAAGDPYATGHTIAQEVNLTTTAVTTTRTTTTKTTVRTITSLYEEGMEGWDLEASFLIPGIDQYLDVSLIGGYYHFDNQPFGPQRGGSGNTEGFKAGIEIRPVPALVLTGMWYEDEGLTGSDWVAGVGLQIPLGKDWKDAFKSRRRHLAERLGEPVARQNAAIKTARSHDVDQKVTQQSSSRTAVRRTVTQSKQRITIAEDIVFVNNGDAVGNGIQAGSASGDGSAENPVDSIQGGADIAATKAGVWTVYTQGTPISYNESVTLSSSVKLTSSFVGITSPYGGTFGGDTSHALVYGGFAGDADDFMASSATTPSVAISGYEITGGYDGATSSPAHSSAVDAEAAVNAGIYLNNVEEVNIADNVIKDMTGAGIIITSDMPENVSVDLANNNLTDNKGIALLVDGANIAGNIFNNQVTGSSDRGLYIKAEEFASIGGNFTGNIIGNTWDQSDESGMEILVDGDFVGLIADNNANENGKNGIYVRTSGDFTGDIIDNTTNSNAQLDGIGGIYTHIEGNFTGDVSYNKANNNTGYGIYHRVSGKIIGNVIGNETNETIETSLNGIGLAVYIYGGFEGRIKNNTANENSSDGMYIYTESSGNFLGDINGNIANSNSRFGINGAFYGNYIGNISGNTANDNSLTNIDVDLYNDYRGSISDNIANISISDNGIDINSYGSSSEFDAQIANNTANGNYKNGILLNTAGDFSGSIINNVTYGNLTGAGMYIAVAGEFNGIAVGNSANYNKNGFNTRATSIGIDAEVSPNNAFGNDIDFFTVDLPSVMIIEP